jgi:hypothetical protein
VGRALISEPGLKHMKSMIGQAASFPFGFMGDDGYVLWFIIVAAGLVCILAATRRNTPTGVLMVAFPLQLLLVFLIGVMLVYVLTSGWGFVAPVLRHQFMGEGVAFMSTPQSIPAWPANLNVAPRPRPASTPAEFTFGEPPAAAAGDSHSVHFKSALTAVRRKRRVAAIRLKTNGN